MLYFFAFPTSYLVESGFGWMTKLLSKVRGSPDFLQLVTWSERCMYRASCFNVYINQRDATLLMNDLYFPLFGSTCFGLSPVHHQEHHLINCITYWYVRAAECSCCVDVHPRNSYTRLIARTYQCVIQFMR